MRTRFYYSTIAIVLAIVFLFAFTISAKAGGLITYIDDHSITAEGGDGGDASATATGGNAMAVIAPGAVKVRNSNHNTNLNLNRNTNLNSNLNVNNNKNVNKNNNTNLNLLNNRQSQNQGQIQAQKQNQNQMQGQGQNQTAHNEGVTQSITQNYEDKRDHISGPDMLKSDAKFSRGKVTRVKTYGVFGILSRVKILTVAQADKLSSKASDIDIEPALLFENDFSTDKMRIGEKGVFMGYLYVLSDGPDVNGAAMVGEAAALGMKMGGTHIALEFLDSGDQAMGSAWNIGFGGGASIVSTNDRVAVAPTGGFGYGKAKASNEARPSVVFSLFFDESLIPSTKVKANPFEHQVVSR